ncbi:hypothetical protein ABT187_44385 [Streptomyces sp. NPDC001817]|uniref:hypothetical protein n=1 Tax=Streptomyces sp. NPDC001817 TaxID=3154398 RepID=UPI00332D69FE
MSSDPTGATNLRLARLAPTGIAWDVIQVARLLALQAVDGIGAPGAVICATQPRSSQGGGAVGTHPDTTADHCPNVWSRHLRIEQLIDFRLRL